MKFEYKVLTFNELNSDSDVDLELILKQHGSEGWELVSAVPIVYGGNYDNDFSVSTAKIKCIFKREI